MSAANLTVNQYHYSVREYDAVTNHLRLIQSSLAKIGIGGEIFASESRAFPQGMLPFDPHRIWDCDLLLVHHSHGNPDLEKVLEVHVPKVLVYHNITPAEFFTHDLFISDLCHLGRRQLKDLKSQVIASFADSEYNASELIEVGFNQPEVFPLLDLKELSAPIRPWQPKDPFELLFVGRICPHKNQAFLIKTLYSLRQLGVNAVVTLIGTEDKLYGEYLKLLAKALGLEKEVRFAGVLDDGGLRVAYENASAFFCASLHEGFCIPLVESMKADLPIFALPTPGVKGTLGDGGVDLSENPEECAKLLQSFLNDSNAMRAVQNQGRTRYTHLREIHNEKRIQSFIQGLLR